MSRHILNPLLVLAVASLAACGGGGSSPASSTAMAQGAAVTTANTDDAVSGIAMALAARDGRANTNAAAVGTSRSLGNSADLFVQGVPEAVTPAAALPIDSTGRVFYVDSNLGDDASNGRAAMAGATGVGPWKTLAKVAQATLAAGDTVLLACGSTWRETLRLQASGTAAHPITVAAQTFGCTTPPAIDGGVIIASAAWTQHSGNIYKTPLATAPTQVFATTGTFTEAHHPNRGYLASDPTTPYAALAADGNAVAVNGNVGSTVLTMGSDIAAGNVSAGARVRTRTGNWLIDESTITAVNGRQLTLSKPTSYPLAAGRGYMLLGQLWMLDSAGEWFYDVAGKMLYAWLPTSAAPGNAVTVGQLATGIDLSSLKNIVVDGIAVRRVGAGIAMRETQSVRIRNSVIEDVADLGIDASVTANAVIESNKISRTGSDAIIGDYSTGMTVRDNLLRDIAVLMQGETVLSLPRNSDGAIRPGVSSSVTGNTLINVGYIGIRPGTTSTVADNFIFGACSVLDDGSAIQVWTDTGVTVRHNTVIHSRGAMAGKPPTEQYTQAQGIYLDESTDNTTIDDNTVIDTDSGIQVHVSSFNTISNNRLYGNRVSQLWMQATTAPNSLVGNIVTGNQIGAVTAGTAGLLLQSGLASTSGFGTFDSNRYYERASATVAMVNTSLGIGTYTVTQWRQSSGVGSTLPVDVNGGGVGGGGYASYNVSGSNLVPNTSLMTGSEGWSTWNETMPTGQLFRESCTPGKCLRYVAGGSWGLVSSPNFSVQQGQWYRLTVDLASQTANQYVQIILRRGGGNYESLSDRDLSFTTPDTGWGRYSVVFQATITDLTGLAAITGDQGARVDFVNIQTGKSVSMANLELVTVTPGTFAQSSGAVVNASAAAAPVQCPYSSTQPSLCAKLVNLANNQPVTWPVTLAARSSMLFYGQEPTLIDSDGDGIPDAQDSCPNTATGAAVNARGCSFVQN